MPEINETFCTIIGCMDGRGQDPVANLGRQKFEAHFVDTITETGLVGMLSKVPLNKELLASLEKKIKISIDIHHSKGIIVHGHKKCAGNPVDDKTHKQDIVKSVQIIRKLIKKKIPVVPVFVDYINSEWVAEILI